MRRSLKFVSTIITIIAISYVSLLIYPDPLFKNKLVHNNFHVFSDREIPIEIKDILNKAQERLSHSELFKQDTKFKLYFCNDDWRFTLFTRNPKAGGVVNGFISANAFFRRSDIRNNRLDLKNLLNPMDRPLSYFVTHELTHSLQSKYDRLMILKTPKYIMEGYADYIGKGYAFNYERYKKMLLNDDPAMNPEKSGLYNLYHLAIAYLLEKKQLSFVEILNEKPELNTILQQIKSE